MLGLSWSMVRSATGQFGQATWVSHSKTVSRPTTCYLLRTVPHAYFTAYQPDSSGVSLALQTMFTKINPVTGALPGSGPPLNQLNFDTYHRWTLIGTYNYHLYTGDDGFI